MNFSVRNFFVFHSDKNEEQCKICKSTFLKGSSTADMKKHLMQHHAAAYQNEIEANKDCEPAEKKRKIEVTISRREMKEISELLTANMPAEIFEKATFKTLADQILGGLEMNPEEVLKIEKT